MHKDINLPYHLSISTFNMHGMRIYAWENALVLNFMGKFSQTANSVTQCVEFILQLETVVGYI